MIIVVLYCAKKDKYIWSLYSVRLPTERGKLITRTVQLITVYVLGSDIINVQTGKMGVS